MEFELVQCILEYQQKNVADIAIIEETKNVPVLVVKRSQNNQEQGLVQLNQQIKAGFDILKTWQPAKLAIYGAAISGLASTICITSA